MCPERRQVSCSDPGKPDSWHGSGPTWGPSRAHMALGSGLGSQAAQPATSSCAQSHPRVPPPRRAHFPRSDACVRGAALFLGGLMRGPCSSLLPSTPWSSEPPRLPTHPSCGPCFLEGVCPGFLAALNTWSGVAGRTPTPGFPLHQGQATFCQPLARRAPPSRIHLLGLRPDLPPREGAAPGDPRPSRVRPPSFPAPPPPREISPASPSLPGVFPSITSPLHLLE